MTQSAFYKVERSIQRRRYHDADRNSQRVANVNLLQNAKFTFHDHFFLFFGFELAELLIASNFKDGL